MRNRSRVLIADDDAAVRRVLTRVLDANGYRTLTADNGEKAFDMTQTERPDLVLLDVRMPGIDGFEVCRRLKSDSALYLIPVVLLTGLRAHAERLRGIKAGADDFLSKPADKEELLARVASLIRVKHLTDELDSTQAVIVSLASTIESRDPYTNGHCMRVARYATQLGKQLQLNDIGLAALHRGGLLHDIGKVAVPDAILLKSTPLTAEERAVMQQHTVVGEEICRQLRSLHPVCPMVRSHHERQDGSGYPDGLSGDDIPLLAQILSIADSYDALTSARPYRLAMTTRLAIDELNVESRKGWRDADLVRAFASVCERPTAFRREDVGDAAVSPCIA